MAATDVWAPKQFDMSGSLSSANGNRYGLRKMFDKPIALKAIKDTFSASVPAAELVAYHVADKEFDLLGTNAVTANSALAVEGGLDLVTNGGSADSAIILPSLVTNGSAWSKVTWGSDRETEWGVWMRTAAALTNTTIWAGLKLTNTPVTATDDDQVFFRFTAGTNTTWQCVYSIGGVDTVVDSGVTVAAATEYRLWVLIDANRKARFFINGALVATSAALTDAKDFIPYVGVLSATDASAKRAYLREQWISRLSA